MRAAFCQEFDRLLGGFHEDLDGSEKERCIFTLDGSFMMHLTSAKSTSSLVSTIVHFRCLKRIDFTRHLNIQSSL